MHGHIPKPAPVKLGSPMTAEEREAARKNAQPLTEWLIHPVEDVWAADTGINADALAGQFIASE